MRGMVHTAKRLLPFAKNKVIHIDAVENPVLIRLLRDDRTLPLLRAGLKSIDPQYEILIPYKVDDEEAQLKRYIQWHMGTTVNLSELRRRHLKYYLRLYDYGSPAEVIRRWGLTPEHDRIFTEKGMLEALEAFRDEDGIVKGVTKDERLYKSLKYYAGKAGKSVQEYLKGHNIPYRGRGTDG